MANMLCMAVQPDYESRLPMFSDLMHKNRKGPERPKTAAEIKEEIVRKLLGGVKQDGNDGLHAGRADSAG